MTKTPTPPSDLSEQHLAFLRKIGAYDVRHNSHEQLLPHLRGTCELLRSWGARAELCDAGLFHSVYGTEFFATDTLQTSARAEIQEVIGEEAEALVWLWCFGRRHSLKGALTGETELRMQDRRTEEWLPITRQQLRDLVNLWIADALEQLHRVPDREIPIARELMNYREHALPLAGEALAQVLSTPGTQHTLNLAPDRRWGKTPPTLRP